MHPIVSQIIGILGGSNVQQAVAQRAAFGLFSCHSNFICGSSVIKPINADT